MEDNLLINFLIDDINTFREHNKSFSLLPAIEKYEQIKNIILQSDTIIFFTMSQCFLKNSIESKCMEVLKEKSIKYKNVTVNYPALGYTESICPSDETFCYSLDISTEEKKKLFLDNYCLYEHDHFLLVLPTLDTSFKVADERSYAPYKFYFLSDMQIKMIIEHHTREVIIL